MNTNNNHLGNLSRLVGHPVTRYEYMLSRDDVMNAWFKAHVDLGYPLSVKATDFCPITDGIACP